MTTDSTAPLQLGILLRQGELHRSGEQGRTVGWADLKDMARVSEDVGFDTVWIGDHLLLRDAPQDDQPVVLPEGVQAAGMWEAVALLGALATVTTRVTFGPAAACTSFRNPALLARAADTLDEISGGRFLLMLGAGWHSPEYVAYGYPFDHRVSRFEEALKIIVPLLREGHVDFQGQYYLARDCELRPRGPRKTGPPIWIGAKKPRMMRLAAQFADVHNYGAHGGAQQARELATLLDTACRAVGRDPATLGRTCNVQVIAPGADDPYATAASLRGSADELAERLLEYKATGVTHITLYAFPWELRTIERLGPVIAAVRRLEGADSARSIPG